MRTHAFPGQTDGPARLSLTEFVCMMAMMAAMVAFAIDSMLPAMGEIAAELTPDAPNRVQWVMSSFFLGMGVGTIVTGPIADAFGRRATILWGIVVYCVGAGLAYQAESFEAVLAARMLQGIGVAGPRVASMAVTRDLYEGRNMARVISLMMMVFTLVPAVAPLIGSWITGTFGWRSIFLSFIVFASLVGLWFALRQAETLPLAQRRPFRLSAIWAGTLEMGRQRQVVLTILAQTFAFTIIFMVITTSQQVFDVFFGRADLFPICFAVIALFGASAGYINARIVVRLGMRRVVIFAMAGQACLSLGMILVLLADPGDTVLFATYMFWIWTCFMTAGLTIGNLNAMGLEPLGHIAGLASSIISAVSTIGSVILAFPGGLLFDGTPWVQTIWIGLCGALGLAVILRTSETSG